MLLGIDSPSLWISAAGMSTVLPKDSPSFCVLKVEKRVVGHLSSCGTIHYVSPRILSLNFTHLVMEGFSSCPPHQKQVSEWYFLETGFVFHNTTGHVSVWETS